MLQSKTIPLRVFAICHFVYFSMRWNVACRNDQNDHADIALDLQVGKAGADFWEVCCIWGPKEHLRDAAPCDIISRSPNEARSQMNRTCSMAKARTPVHARVRLGQNRVCTNQNAQFVLCPYMVTPLTRRSGDGRV